MDYKSRQKSLFFELILISLVFGLWARLVSWCYRRFSFFSATTGASPKSNFLFLGATMGALLISCLLALVVNAATSWLYWYMFERGEQTHVHIQDIVRHFFRLDIRQRTNCGLTILALLSTTYLTVVHRAHRGLEVLDRI